MPEFTISLWGRWPTRALRFSSATHRFSWASSHGRPHTWEVGSLSLPGSGRWVGGHSWSHPLAHWAKGTATKCLTGRCISHTFSLTGRRLESSHFSKSSLWVETHSAISALATSHGPTDLGGGRPWRRCLCIPAQIGAPQGGLGALGTPQILTTSQWEGAPGALPPPLGLHHRHLLLHGHSHISFL